MSTKKENIQLGDRYLSVGTKESLQNFPGMTPSQILKFVFRDAIGWDEGNDLNKSAKQVSRLRSWCRRGEIRNEQELKRDGWQRFLDRLEFKEEKMEREAKKWFGLVVRSALVDEGIIEGDSYALIAEMEKSWGKIEKGGFSVEVDLQSGLVRLRQGDGGRVPKIQVVQYGGKDNPNSFEASYGRLLKKYGPVGLAGMGFVGVAAGCVVPPTSPVVETAPLPTKTAVENPGVTIQPQATVEVVPQVTPTYAVEAAGGPYTEVQLALNNSGSAINQKAIIERWLAYWANFDNRPFDPTSVQLKWKYIYDSNNPTSVLVMLEAGGEYNGRLFMGPIGADGKFAEFPPEVSGTDIGVGYGPLELTAGADGQILSVDSDGVPVRRDGNGNIVEKLNMKTKQWEVIDIKTERERVIVNQINNFLSSSGGYSGDELADKIFVMGIVKYGEGRSDYKDDLGLMRVSENVASVQGINLGSVEGDNCVWMFFGTKMGEEGKRVVLPVRIPLESIEYRVPILITFYNQRDIAPAGQSTVRLLDDQQIALKTAQEIVGNLNGDLLGKPILLDMWYYNPGDVSGFVRDKGGSDDDVRIVTELFRNMEAIQAGSFCDFHPVIDNLLEKYDCQGEYLGPIIDSKIEKIDRNWYVNPGSLSITILTSYSDN